MQELNSRAFLCSASGGTLDYVSPQGEVLFSVFVPAGRISAREYLDLVPDGCTVEVSDGLAVVMPRSNVGIQPYGAGSHDSGANPDFKPTSASRMESEMRLSINRMNQASQRLEARARAFEGIERIPLAPSELVTSLTPDPDLKLVE